jgi:TonB family protein
MSEKSNKSFLRSAEAVVSVSLLAVCTAVAGAYWILASKELPLRPSAITPVKTSGSTPNSSVDESSALVALNHRLQGDFAQLDKQRELLEQRSELERRAQTAEEKAENAERRAEHTQTQTQVAAAQPASPAVLQPAAPSQAAAPAPARVPVHNEAAVDWTSCRRPEYPSSSVERGEEGVVTLSFKINAYGAVQGSEVLNSSGSTWLDDAALRALSKCHFKPATEDGAPVASVAKMRFQWHLGN